MSQAPKGSDRVECPYCGCNTTRRHVARCKQQDNWTGDTVDPNTLPVKAYKCWDCGSTIPNHHTELCELAEPVCVRDLPAVPGTQWWTVAAKAAGVA